MKVRNILILLLALLLPLRTLGAMTDVRCHGLPKTDVQATQADCLSHTEAPAPADLDCDSDPALAHHCAGAACCPAAFGATVLPLAEARRMSAEAPVYWPVAMRVHIPPLLDRPPR